MVLPFMSPATLPCSIVFDMFISVHDSNLVSFNFDMICRVYCRLYAQHNVQRPEHHHVHPGFVKFISLSFELSLKVNAEC